MTKGIFITFEGGEGAGKSTHIGFAASYFRKKGKEVVVVREPGCTALGEKIRHILLDPRNKMSVETELFLYLIARARLVSEVIRPAIEKGNVVISDRYEDSTIVYQGYAGGLPLDQVKKAAKEARGNLEPRLTFLLDLNVKEGLKRSGMKDRMEHKSIRFHEKIRKGYLALAKQDPKRFVVISSEAPKPDVQRKIKEKLDHVFN